MAERKIERVSLFPHGFCLMTLSLLNRPSLKTLGESMSSLGMTRNSLLNKQNVIKDSFIKYLSVIYLIS